MVNCNPETVSTDYDTSDRLYFEPLGVEEVLGDLRARAAGRASSSSSAARRRSSSRARSRRPASGSSGRRSTRSTSPRTASASARSATSSGSAARTGGWPTTARRGGRGRRAHRLPGARAAVVRARRPRDARLLRRRGASATAAARRAARVLVDRFLENAIEIDVDALCDGEETYVAAVMQHVEEAGVHSGDSSCVLPAPSLDAADAAREIDAVVRRLAPALGVVGLVNVQLAVADGEVFVLEANPRASRTVPFASKATGVNLVEAACRLAAGATLAELELPRRASRRSRCQRQGGGAPVRALPRQRPGARPGDALDRRGDGHRLRPADRVREGRARRGPAAADERDRVPLGARRRQGGARPGRAGARRARLQAARHGRHGARRSPPPGWRSSVRKVAEDGDGRRSSTSIRRGRCDLVDQHAAGLGRAHATAT